MYTTHVHLVFIWFFTYVHVHLLATGCEAIWEVGLHIWLNWVILYFSPIYTQVQTFKHKCLCVSIYLFNRKLLNYFHNTTNCGSFLPSDYVFVEKVITRNMVCFPVLHFLHKYSKYHIKKMVMTVVSLCARFVIHIHILIHNRHLNNYIIDTIAS